MVLAAIQIALALFWVEPGPLSIDEVLYQTMARSAAEGHPLWVTNGYEELPSPELATVDYMRTAGGHLTVQYPLLFPLLAGPLVRSVGPLALFLMNAAAFAGVLVFTWRIGARLFGARPALVGAALLATGTFAWDYAMAAWPHMLALLLELAAFDLVIAIVLSEREEARPWVGAIAGALLGLAVGFRRDAVFFFPIAALPLLFTQPPRGRSLAALAVGALPPLALVGWLNWLRWGSWSPLSYGGAMQSGYQLLGAVGALGVAALVVVARPSVRRRFAGAFRVRPAPVLLAALSLALVLLALPATSRYSLRALEGAEALLWDLRGSATEIAGGRLFHFAVLYAGGLKKSLLQSLPWLPVLLVPLARAWRDPVERRAVLLLLLPVTVYVGVQVFLNRHGGMSLNLRYYLPALPFLALLGARGLTDVARGLTSRALSIAVGAPAAAALALWIALRPDTFDAPGDAVWPVLNVPLVLAVLTAGAAATWQWGRGAELRRSLALIGLAAAALGWSACLAFDYDARWSRAVRMANLRTTVEAASKITPHSLLFSQLPDWDGMVPAFVDDVIVAYPAVDGYQDFHRLATHHLDAGRRVYASFDERTWEVLRAEGRVAGLEFRMLGGAGRAVMEIRRAPG